MTSNHVKTTLMGNHKINKVSVEIYIEEMYSDQREQAVKGEFTFVAIDENKKPVSLNI